MSKIIEFEKAIREFGVDAAMEYFCTPDGLKDILRDSIGVAATPENKSTVGDERLKPPTADQIIDFALVFNDGKIEPEKLADMVGMCQLIVDRLYENGDILIPSLKENNNG